MLHNAQRSQGWMRAKVDGVTVEYSLVQGGTKVSVHALHALLGLTIT